MIIREQNSELAHQWLALAEKSGASKWNQAAIAQAYAILAVADALAIVHREIAYVAECITGGNE